MVRTKATFVLCYWTVVVSAGSFDSDNHGYRNDKKQTSAAIVLHRQQVDPDGAVRFAFAGEDGQQRAESIAPDGSRTGAYSYTSPDGVQVNVKYTAGKDGFRILTGGEEDNNYGSAPQKLSYSSPIAPVTRKKSSGIKFRAPPAPSVSYNAPGGFSGRSSLSESGYRVHEDLERSAELGTFNLKDDGDYSGEYNTAASFASKAEPTDNGPAFGAGYAFEFGGRGGGPDF
ncbi:uncharacterized protein LOC126907650 [Daktulosphaira vitifoliae]|uniref:uncharacterized protein LOC126907650 n=1 Tax=Daktulosphaira vitifoliae TaxID=58002 RepID=UPI0021AA2C7F|nr:uncharacterized protein LOC126907650 [Daktulosphaira vitifoliae]